MPRTFNNRVLQGGAGGWIDEALALVDEALALDIHQERVRAHKKHVATGMSMEQQEYIHWRWMPVMMEELGEMARVLNDREKDMGIGVPEHMIMDKLRKETIQLMAMCSAFIDSIDMHNLDNST